MSEKTFKLTAPHMKGDDVGAWQQVLFDRFRAWNIDYPVIIDGDYGQATRSATASFCRAWGIESAAEAMKNGVTPELRIKLRNDKRSSAEADRFMSAERKEYRAALRERYDHKDLASPVSKILEDSWGWHPGVHDGIDLICPPNASLFAIVTGRVIRADAGGWWGLGAPADQALKAKGDGIIIIRATVDVGPFKSGMNFCYGHAEHAVVQGGERVTAGQHIGTAGFANAWHVHFMVNDNNDDRGVGDRDPKPYVDYARSHA